MKRECSINDVQWKRKERKIKKSVCFTVRNAWTFTERELTSSDEGDIVGLIVLTCRLARNSDELVSMPGNQTGISAADGNWPSYQCQSRNWKSARRFCYKRFAVLTGRRKILRRCNSIITIADGARLPYDPVREENGGNYYFAHNRPFLYRFMISAVREIIPHSASNSCIVRWNKMFYA